MMRLTGFLRRDWRTELRRVLERRVPSREITERRFTRRGVIGFGDTLSSCTGGSGCEYSMLYSGRGCFFFRLVRTVEETERERGNQILC